MYEQVRAKFYHECMAHMNQEDAAIAAGILDSVMIDYDIKAKENALVVYDGENVPQIVEYYIDCCKVRRLSNGTIANRKQILKKFFNTMNVTVKDTRKIHIRQFLAIIEQNGLKPSSVDNYYKTLKCFFNWCQDEEIITANPMHNVERVKYTKNARQPLTDVEVEKIRNACEDNKERAMFEFLIGTGVRVSEMCNLKAADVLWDERNGDLTPIKVINGKGGKDRTVFLKDTGMLYLKKYLEEKTDESEYLFSHSGKGYKRVQIGRLCRELKQRAGINKPFSPHVCRHTMATKLSRTAEMQTVQAVLGHSSMTTTMIYAHTDNNRIMADLSRYGA